MTAVLIVLLLVAFVATDYLVRTTLRRLREKRERAARAAALDRVVRLDFTYDAKSLTRVEAPHPSARILAVDDEPVVLDSLRRILVLEGFSVDTVEHGREALGLVQRRDYDFVFTDLKMPDMDGVEVVKAVKHLRPDVDVVVVTGYGSIETAVETLQHGASDYLQKPFTADELGEFARRLLVKRQARLEAARRPSVRVVSPETADAVPPSEFCVPGGFFLSSGHAWVRIEPEGRVRIGIDDFARKALGTVTAVSLPAPGTTVRQGETLFTLTSAAGAVHVAAPLSGRVEQDNAALTADPAALVESPYHRGWVCELTPSDLGLELGTLKIGRPVIEWYQDEISRLGARANGPLDWGAIQERFLDAPQPARA